jgi:hypothetical protein
MRCLGYLILLAACTDFDDVSRGVCGNGLLEPNEDCDSSDASCVRAVRGAGARIVTELAQGVGLRSLRVADVTGDGIDDVIAVQGDQNSSALVVFAQCTSRNRDACRSEGRSQSSTSS